MLVLKGSSFLQDGDWRMRGIVGIELAHCLVSVLQEHCPPSPVSHHSDGLSGHEHYLPGSLPTHGSALISR